MKKLGLVGGVALALFGLSAPASAVTVSLSGPFPTLDLSSAGSATNGRVTSASGSVGNVAYSFTGGTTAISGIYSGTETGISASPYAGSPQVNYFTAGGGTVATPGTVTLSTINNDTFTRVDVLWGTVDSGALRNLIIANNAGGSISGDQLVTDLGVVADGTHNVFLSILFDKPFSSLTFSDFSDNSFEFNIRVPSDGQFGSAPEASTWAMMLLGFLGLGILGYRKSSKNSAQAFRVA